MCLLSGLAATEKTFRSIDYEGFPMRVLSVPLSVGGRSAGTMQIASSLAVIESVREDLLYVLIMGAIFAILLAAIGSWLVIERSLAPLDIVVETTEQINRADLADMHRNPSPVGRRLQTSPKEREEPFVRGYSIPVAVVSAHLIEALR